MAGDVQPGPCIVCGRTNYPLSVGGPSICPACDCGDSGPAVVNAQRIEIERLRALAADLLAALKAVVVISDRKHDAWDRAHAVIAKAEGR